MSTDEGAFRTLLFGAASLKEARQIKLTLDTYTLVLGQKVNAQKSKIYLFNTNQILSNKLINILGFSIEQISSMYLGLPFFMGENKISYCSSIIARIRSRILAWKARWLSLSGRILLIKTVLSIIPNFYLVFLKAPSSFVHQIEKLIRGFLWKGNLSDETKIPLISLKEMAQSKSIGGGVT